MQSQVHNELYYYITLATSQQHISVSFIQIQTLKKTSPHSRKKKEKKIYYVFDYHCSRNHIPQGKLNVKIPNILIFLYGTNAPLYFFTASLLSIVPEYFICADDAGFKLAYLFLASVLSRGTFGGTIAP